MSAPKPAKPEQPKFTLEPEATPEQYKRFLTSVTTNQINRLTKDQRFSLISRMLVVSLGLCAQLEAANNMSESLAALLEEAVGRLENANFRIDILETAIVEKEGPTK